ncbi:MAG: DUF1622 domain-containing protein [Chloroflexi bacterium]|nr:DUF1622 domain-containing protein [Chloroflexota bacterium]MBV9602909.1 DUF1622 domain-containing protein [Chloroflexota bacterium]
MDEEAGSALVPWIEGAALAIETLAVAIIVVIVTYATARYLIRMAARPRAPDLYEEYRARLGRGLLIGLEILVAADVVRTVALQPSLVNISVLGILVLVRTFLSWSLVVEIEGRWPWQSRKEATAED